MTEIEQVARVIDPEAWAKLDRIMRWADAGRYDDGETIDARQVASMREDAPGIVKDALAKAQAVLNLIKPEGWGPIEAALKTAEDALGDYACHLGPDVPCRRGAWECDALCGKPAGDALLVVRAALAMIQASPPPPVAQ